MWSTDKIYVTLYIMDTAEVKIIDGKLPILLSAPHTYSHKRPSLSGSYKGGEACTDTIVEKICLDINCFGIMQIAETSYDPNYHKEKNNPYKQEAKEIIRVGKIKNFIDIHGLRDGAGYDIGIYYPTRFDRSMAFAQSISEGLNKGELKGASIFLFRFLDNDQETLGEYVASKLRVPSVQIEIARYIREDEILRNAFIENLGKVLKEII